MHQLIHIILTAANEENAKAMSTHILEQLMNEGKYDYFSILDGGHAWADIPAVVEYGSAIGDKLLEEALESTEVSRLGCFTEIKEFFSKHTDQELLGDGWFSYVLMNASGRDSTCVTVFDRSGYGIRCKNQLEEYIRDSHPELEDGYKIYIVSADVHY